MTNFVNWKLALVVIGLLSIIAGAVERHEKQERQKVERVQSFRESMKNNAQDYSDAVDQSDLAKTLKK